MSVVPFFELVLCQSDVGFRTGVVVVGCGHSSSVDDRFREAVAAQGAFTRFSAVACFLLFAFAAAGAIFVGVVIVFDVIVVVGDVVLVYFSVVAGNDVLHIWHAAVAEL